MRLRQLMIVSALAVLAASTMAQGFPPGGGQGGPPPGMGPMGGGMEGPERLLMRTDVQADLQLTDDQKTQVQTLLESMRGQGGPGGPGGGPPPDGPPPGGSGGQGGGQGGPPPGGFGGGPGGQGGPGQGGAQFEAMRKKMADQIAKILTPDQQTRLKEISVQLAGSLAAANPDIQKDLQITDDQKAKIKNLMRKQQEANRSVFDSVRSGDIDRQDVPGIMKKNAEILRTQIAAVLTETQQAKLKTMSGKPFVATDQGFGGPGGGK